MKYVIVTLVAVMLIGCASSPKPKTDQQRIESLEMQLETMRRENMMLARQTAPRNQECKIFCF